MKKLNDINDIINIQFRIPKRFVNDFNDFVKSIGHNTSHNQVVKAVVVKWLEKKFNEVNDVSNITNKGEPTTPAEPEEPKTLEELVEGWK
jgi:hypothetical protein